MLDTLDLLNLSHVTLHTSFKHHKQFNLAAMGKYGLVILQIRKRSARKNTLP